MTPKARTIARRLSSGETFSVTFTKRDGTMRMMRCQALDSRVRFSSVDGAPMMTVRDLDKNAVRTINLDEVHTLGQVRPRRSREEEKAANHAAFLEARDELHNLMFA